MHTTTEITPGNIIAATICRAAELGLAITDTADDGDRTIIYATPTHCDNHCPRCHQPAVLRDHVTRSLVDLPAAGVPTVLRVRNATATGPTAAGPALWWNRRRWWSWVCRSSRCRR